jgi:hypothetical protein
LAAIERVASKIELPAAIEYIRNFEEENGMISAKIIHYENN